MIRIILCWRECCHLRQRHVIISTVSISLGMLIYENASRSPDDPIYTVETIGM